jgi:hypothetical protein
MDVRVGMNYEPVLNQQSPTWGGHKYHDLVYRGSPTNCLLTEANMKPLEHREGWIVSGQKTLFILVPSHSQPRWLATFYPYTCTYHLPT